VALAGRRKELLEATVTGKQNLRPAGAHSIHRVLAIQPPYKKRYSQRTKEAFPAPRLLFNNAGIGAPGIPLEDLTYEQWKAVVDINVTGAFLLYPGGVPNHEEPGTPRRTNHQQRIDLRSRAAAQFRSVQRPPSMG